MNKKLLSILITAPAVILLAQPAAADPHDGMRRDHGGDFRGEAGRGDGRFEGRDFARWRGGNWRHGFHDGRIGWWWVAGGLWYFYPTPVYPYPDPYVPPVVVQQAPPTVVIQQAPPAPPVQASPPPPQNWYYCEPSKSYYPYVSSCPVEWKLVPATSPGVAR
jgi:hypothetical protein